MTRNQKVIRITAELFVDSCLRDIAAQSLVGDIPEDITIRGARFESFDNSLEFLVESSGFPEVPEGARPEGWKGMLPEEWDKKTTYDIAVWEIDLASWEATRELEDLEQRVRATLELEPTKIWGEKHPFIPRKGEEVQIGHSLYEVVGVSYDLEEDYTRLLVVKLR